MTRARENANGAIDNSVTLAKMAGGTDGNLITYDTSGDPAYVATGTSGHVLTSAGADAVPAFAVLPPAGVPRNYLINGDFQVAQRATSFVASANNDDVYTLDRWNLLSDTNDVVDVTQSSTAPTNQLYSIGLDVETVNKKFGIAQIIENKNCVGLIGNNVTFSFKAKVSATTKLDNVKAGIIAWSSTADSVTSDVVSAWAVEGTNPTLASNLTFENTPANLSVTTSWATYSVSANIDTSSTTNVIVFIWSDVTDTTAGDFLYITDCQLEQGSNATPYERRNYGEEEARCLRYYNAPVGGGIRACGTSSSTSNFTFSYAVGVRMRIQPALVHVNSAAHRAYHSGGYSSSTTNFTISNMKGDIVQMNAPGHSGLTDNRPYILGMTGSYEVDLDSEL